MLRLARYYYLRAKMDAIYVVAVPPILFMAFIMNNVTTADKIADYSGAKIDVIEEEIYRLGY